MSRPRALLSSLPYNNRRQPTAETLLLLPSLPRCLHEREPVTANEDASLQLFNYALKVRGWMQFDSVVPASLCQRMRADIAKHVERCGELQIAAGIPTAPDGTAHHTLGFADSLDEFLEAGFLNEHVAHFFGGPFILHAFNPVTIPSDGRNYVHRIHRDLRTYPGSFRLLMNMLVMVDPFTIENGATYILSGSHNDSSPPPDDFFYRYADRITGPIGSIVLFDSNVWHAAGDNRSGNARTALTLSLSRPFLKPQMDYPRLIGLERGKGLSERMRQLYGYNARVPASLDEWYRPASARLYRSDQG
jgi:hypothetical protein